jgi:hypothetical protein
MTDSPPATGRQGPGGCQRDFIESAIADWDVGVLHAGGKGMRHETDGLDERRRDSVVMRCQPAIGDSGDASTFRACLGEKVAPRSIRFRHTGFGRETGTGTTIRTFRKCFPT